MNANELADELDGFLKEQEQLPWGTKQVYLDQAATMLRQQQAEIERLTTKNLEWLTIWNEQQAEIEEHEKCTSQMASRIATYYDEIEEWKRKYKDMHNLATQAMSRVHELEKAQQ